jgi:hypothetical protein
MASNFFDVPGRREAAFTAFCHIAMPILRHLADDGMHALEFIVPGFLIACMLFAAAKVLPRRNS